MKIKTVLYSALIFLGAYVPFFISFYYINEVSITLEKLSPFLDAPKIADEKDFEGIDNQIVWISGMLAPVQPGTVLTAPLSQKKCLYYQYEKQREDEGDEDTSPSWDVEEKMIKSTDVVIMTGDKQTLVNADQFVLARMAPEIEYEEEIDKTKFRFIEYMIPLENQVSIIGILKNGELGPIDRGILVCLSSFDTLVPEFKTGVAASLFFIALGFILGTGLIALSLTLLLHGRIQFLSSDNILFLFGTLCYIWMITGGVTMSISGVTIVDRIVPLTATAVMSGIILLLLIFYACRDKKTLAAFLFIPAVGLAALSAFFYYDVLFTVGNWRLSLYAAIPLSAGAAFLIVFCRWITGRLKAGYKRGEEK
ncbi:MAG: hypothetical protein JW904_06325 [Spirochaetales bacterium]|nr:hypothetical protein [Spirochaetales bacterium]